MIEKYRFMNIEHQKEILSLPGIIGKQLYDSNQTEIVHLKIESGYKISKHSLPIPVTFFITEGIVDFYIEDEVIASEKGSYIHIEPNIERGISNNHSLDAKILVIKEKIMEEL